jgi:hypothetical protein
MSMYVVVLCDIELGPIESLHPGMTLFGAPTGAPSIPAVLTSTGSKVIQVLSATSHAERVRWPISQLAK